MLGIALGNAYKLCQQPGFPAIRVSARRIIIPKQELDEWLHTQATGARTWEGGI